MGRGEVALVRWRQFLLLLLLLLLHALVGGRLLLLLKGIVRSGLYAHVRRLSEGRQCCKPEKTSRFRHRSSHGMASVHARCVIAA